jgi:hypothetical protein
VTTSGAPFKDFQAGLLSIHLDNNSGTTIQISEEEDDPTGWVVAGEKTPRSAAGGIDPPRLFL